MQTHEEVGIFSFPLSAAEARTVRWATRIVPAVAVAVTAFLAFMSVACAAG